MDMMNWEGSLRELYEHSGKFEISDDPELDRLWKQACSFYEPLKVVEEAIYIRV